VTRHILLVVENVSLARDHRLRKQATSLRAAGYDVTVICRRDPDNRRLEGVRVLDYPPPADAGSRLAFLWEYAYSWGMAAALTWRVYLSQPFHVIQISGMPDIYFTIAAPFRLLGVPLVLDQRDLSPEVYIARYGTSKGFIHRVLLTCERLSFRAADHVVTVNETLRTVAQQRGGLGADAVTVVGNGPRISRATANDRSFARPQGAGAGSVCCWVGLMGPQDRLDLALRAVAHLVHDRGRDDLRTVVVGDGEERLHLEQLVDELGIGRHVEFTGWLGEDEVFHHLRTADVGLEPNMEPVVSPVKVMEYMASGLPFVAFDLAETRTLGEGSGEYVPQGDVVAFAEAIDGLLSDPARRDRMGAVGRQLVSERVAWEHQEVAYLRIFRRLLARPGRHGRSGLWVGSR
jgi:glycosyltransferase involved in cell wall biosynthesis